MVKVYPPYGIGEKVGHVLEVDASSLNELLQKLKTEYGDEFMVAIKDCTILVNGIDHFRLNGPNTRLSDGDYVAFINPASTGF